MPVRTYKSPLWKVAHPVKHLKNEARRALRQMRPGRVAARFFNVAEIRSVTGTRTTRVTAESRRRQAEQYEKRQARGQQPAAAKKAAAKKASKRADPYVDALKIPARNRKAGAAMTKAAQPAKKTVAVRKKDGSGKFDGRQSMRSDDLATYTRAQQPAADPALFARDLRGRRTR